MDLAVEVVTNELGLQLKGESLIDFINLAQAEALVIGLEPFDETIISQCPSLRFVAKYGVGLDNLDLDDLSRHGLPLGWTPGVNRRSVAELVLSYALGHVRNVVPSIMKMKQGLWVKNGGFNLSGRKFGIVGLGHIGSDLGTLLKAFGCDIYYTDVVDKLDTARLLGAQYLPYPELLKTCEIISFHVPSTALTRNMYNAQAIEVTRHGALIINTSRGDIVDFEAVVNAVRGGYLGGFASDVFESEPFNAEAYPDQNLYFTPHIGGNSHESVLEMGRSAIDHIAKYLKVRNAR
jgi:D-3-phosphoglycerate dehydrogenase